MNQKKQQLQHNELADWLELKIEELKPHFPIIGGGILIVVLAVFGAFFWLSRENQAVSEAWIAYSNAADEARYNDSTDPLKDASKDFPGTTAAMWSLQMLADVKLKNGLTSLYEKRDQGQGDIEEALNRYSEVADGTPKGSMLNNHAVLGQSIAYEALGKMPEALSGYQTLVDASPKSEAGEPTSPIGKLAQKYYDRLNSFKDQRASDFYDSFVAYTPSVMPSNTPPGFGGPNAVGGGNNGLRTLPDISFPDPLDLDAGGDEDSAEEPPMEQPNTGGGSLKPPANAPESTDGGTSSENSDSEGDAGTEGSEDASDQ
jgi:tetratricopeptide (TPR) repeat protein